MLTEIASADVAQSPEVTLSTQALSVSIVGRNRSVGSDEVQKLKVGLE